MSSIPEQQWGNPDSPEENDPKPCEILEYLEDFREQLYRNFYEDHIDGYRERMDALNETHDKITREMLMNDVREAVDSFFNGGVRYAESAFELSEIQNAIISIVGVEIAKEAIENRLKRTHSTTSISTNVISLMSTEKGIAADCLLKISAMFIKNDSIFFNDSVAHTKRFIARQPYDDVEIDFSECRQLAIKYIIEIFEWLELEVPWEINELTESI